jgi:hypothetical protein
MNDSKREEGNHVTDKTSSKAMATSRQWHFLIVGEHGQIKSIKKFRTLAIAAVTVVTVGIVGIASLGFLYLRALAHKSRLNHALTELQQQVTAISAEKDILMARLVIAETKHKSNPEPGATVAAEQPAPVAQPEKAPPPERPAAAAGSPALTLPSEKNVAPPASEAEQGASDVQPGTSVAVEDVSATLDTYQNILTVQYTVRNTTPDGTPIAGHTVIVLKDSELDPEDWLVLPDVKLVDGKPTGERGQPFRITRFRIAKFTVEGHTEPSRFSTAVVFVYTKSGELILEQEFPVQIKVT